MSSTGRVLSESDNPVLNEHFTVPTGFFLCAFYFVLGGPKLTFGGTIFQHPYVGIGQKYNGWHDCTELSNSFARECEV